MRQVALLIFILTGWSLHAQPPTARYKKWSDENPNVRPYLFFNQSKYSPGDTVRFKAYMFERGEIMKGSFLLTLSVVNRQAQQVAQSEFRVINGISFNQVVLPDTLKSGIYRFIAHNVWMRGNPASPPVWKDLPVTARNSVETPSPVNKGATLFPEGGKLINGITNRMIIKLDGNYDSARLVSDQGAVVAMVRIRDGLGSVHITPEAGKVYSLLVGNNRFSLPKAADDGIGILLTRSASRSSVRVLLAAPPESDHRKNPVHLLLTIHGMPYFSQELSFGDLEFMQFGISLASLPAGLARLSVIGQDNQVISERHFMVDVQVPARLTLQPKREAVQSREQIDVEVTLTDQAGNPVEGEFAVSVVNQKLFSAEPSSSFTDDLVGPLNSGLRPDRSRQDWQERFDQQLITLSSDPLLWQEIFSSQEIQRQTGRHTHFKFTAKDRSTNTPLPDQTRIIVHLQDNTNGYESVVKDGAFDLTLPGDFWGTDEFYFLAESSTGYNGNLDITLLEQKHSFPPAPSSMLSGTVDPYADYSSKVRLINQSYSFFTRQVISERDGADRNFAFEDELNGVDIDIDLSKYIEFPNMDEVLREVIPAVSHRKAGKKSIVRVDLMNTDLIPKADPIYVIDGLMTLDTDYFINLPTDNVLSIKVVRDINKLDRLGRLGRNGVVIVQTAKPNPAAVKATGAYMSVRGLSRPLEFGVTSHSKGERSNIPDFRTTLHWNPMMKTDKKGKAVISFFASDDVGSLAIKVLGTTINGTPFSGQAAVEVLYNDSENR